MEHLNTNIVRIIEISCIELDLLGKTITHKTKGKGVVVGYSSVSGEPFAFFYKDQDTTDRVCCFSYKDII